MENNKVYVPAQVDFRAALSALLYHVMSHDDPKAYCQDMVKNLRVAADVIETRLKPEGTDSAGPR
jgi:hypothetical protein